MILQHLPILFVIGLLLIPTSAAADAPPSWQPFKVCTTASSSGQQFCASVERENSSERVEQSRHILKVRKLDGDSSELLWQREYNYDGYPSGSLSPDGKTFLYVDYWYSENGPVVQVYQEEARYQVKGAAFGIAQSALKQTASHHLWLDAPAETPATDFVDAKQFTIRTIDGEEWLLDLQERCHLYKKPEKTLRERWKSCERLD